MGLLDQEQGQRCSAFLTRPQRQFFFPVFSRSSPGIGRGGVCVLESRFRQTGVESCSVLSLGGPEPLHFLRRASVSSPVDWEAPERKQWRHCCQYETLTVGPVLDSPIASQQPGQAGALPFYK